MNYLILTISSIEYAKSISRFLRVIQKDKDPTTQYFNHWLMHSITHEVALAFPDVDIKLDDEADASLLVDVVRNAITPEEAQAMEDRINQGGNVKPLDFIPQSVGQNIRTQDQMDSDGWFVKN